MESTFENINSLGNGIFTTRDISQILRIPYSKASVWLKKYWEEELGQYYSQIYSWKSGNSKAIGFHTLVELYIMGQLIESGVRPSEIIKAHKQLSEKHDTHFPFANKNVLDGLRTDGKRLYFKNNNFTITLDGTEQLNFDFIKLFFKKLDFGADQMVSKIWPLGKNQHIVCDPHHKFGQPVIEGTNIQAEMIYKMFLAKEPINYIANLYDLSLPQVKKAVQFCQNAA
jgi:uncharacterized protein (DUF433 family)